MNQRVLNVRAQLCAAPVTVFAMFASAVLARQLRAVLDRYLTIDAPELSPLASGDTLDGFAHQSSLSARLRWRTVRVFPCDSYAA